MAGLDQLLRAAADRTRLRLLNLLQEGEICVCDLQAVLGIPQPTVSRHLAVLRHAGLVVDQRAGTRILYSLAPAETPVVQALWQLLAEARRQEEILQGDLQRLRKAQRGQRNALVGEQTRAG